MQATILTFIIPIISMIFTCAFLALWWNDRAQWPILAFAVCFASLAMGVVINIYLLENSNAWGIVLYHLVSMGGVLALMWGIGQRVEVKVPLVFSTISVLIVSIVLWNAIEAGLPNAMRLAQNTNSAMVIALIAASLWHGARRNMADVILMWAIVALAAFAFIRPVLTALFNASATPDSSAMAILGAIHILVLATLLTLIALCLIASIVFSAMQSEREKASSDPLTGLANRAAFETQVELVLEKAKHENVAVSLLVGDIDNFKDVNDTWGHRAGDKVIAAFGSLVSGKVRPEDAVGRIGGEEFCILVWDCEELAAEALANRLRLGFAQAAISGFSSDESFSVSFGVAQWHAGELYEQTFARADQALYAAKRAGRDRVETASDCVASTNSTSPHKVVDGELAQAPHSDGGDVVSFEKIRASKP